MAFIRGLSRRLLIAGIIFTATISLVSADSFVGGETDGNPSFQTTDEDLKLLQDLDNELTPEAESDRDASKDTEDLDLFNELEMTTDAAPGESTGSVFKSLWDHLSGNIRLTGTHFWQNVDNNRNPLADNDRDLEQARLEVSTWLGGDIWRADISGWIEAGDQEDTWINGIEWPQDRDYQKRYYDLNELYMTLSGENGDLTVGKKLLKNGLSTLYSPANRYNSYDFHDPVLPREMGRWMISANHYIDDITFTGTILPVYQPIKFPGKHSRWTALYNSDDISEDDIDYSDFVNFGIFDIEDVEDMDIHADIPDVSFENIGYFGRAKTSLHGWDVFASAYYGLSLYEVIEQKNDKEYEIRLTKTFNLASGFSTTFKKFEYHAEAVYVFSPESNDDDYVNYVIGSTYKMDHLASAVNLDQIVITAEYAGEWVIDDQSADDYVVSSEDIRLGTNDIICRLEFKVNDDLNFEVYYNFELKNDGLFQRYQGRYKLLQGLWATLSCDFFSGASESYYGRWDKNDRTSVALEYAF